MKIRNNLLMVVMMFTATALTAAETYKEAWKKGIKEYRAKKYKESLTALTEAVKLAKTPGEKYNSMCYKGYSLRFLHKFAEAAKVFSELMQVKTLSAGQKNNVFSQYLHNIYYDKRYKEVLDITEKTVADDKASNVMKTTSAYLACQASNNLKKYDDKIKWAKKMQEIQPKGVWYSRGLICQAQALRAQKKYEEAEARLSKENIAKMNPNLQCEAYFERGYIKIAQRKREKAVAEFTTVYELPEAHSNQKDMAVVNIIENWSYLGKTKDAQVWLERIDTIKSKYWKTRGLLRYAQMLQKQGKLKEAKAKWEECKQSGPWWKKVAENQIAAINKKLEAK